VHDKKISSSVIGTTRNNNLAEIVLPRTNYAEQLETRWLTGIPSGQIFISTNGSPPLMTAGQCLAQADQVLTLDPNSFPGIQALVQGPVLTALEHLNAWEVIIAILVALYFAQRGSALTEQALSWGFRRLPWFSKGAKDSHPATMFGLVVRFKCKDQASAEAYDRLAAETIEAIKAHEPRTVMYASHRVKGQPLQRIFYELYRDEHAFHAHEAAPHTQRYRAERDQYLTAIEVDWLALQIGKGTGG